MTEDLLLKHCMLLNQEKTENSVDVPLEFSNSNVLFRHRIQAGSLLLNLDKARPSAQLSPI